MGGCFKYIRATLVVLLTVVLAALIYGFSISPFLRDLRDPPFLAAVLALCFLCNLTAVLDPVALPLEVAIITSLGSTGLILVAVEHYVVKCCCFGLGRTCLRQIAQQHLGRKPMMRAIELTLRERAATVTVILLFLSALPGTTIAYALSITRVELFKFLIGNVAATVKSSALRIALALASDVVNAAAHGQAAELKTIVSLVTFATSVAALTVLGWRITSNLNAIAESESELGSEPEGDSSRALI